MAGKKHRAFFVCPRWSEVAALLPGNTTPAAAPGQARALAAIKAGQPVARSTLRHALLALRRRVGTPFDVDTYIVDQRTTANRQAPGK